MLELEGRSLALEEVELVAAPEASPEVRLADAGRENLRQGRRVIERVLESGEAVYGVNTGFGRLAEVVVPPEARRELQSNLIRSHSAGVGDPLPTEVVRAIMLLRANALARGNSGCRPEVVDALLALLNHKLHPVVPSWGSVGASGDLAPLAHVALALTGEGEMEREGRVEPAEHALKGVGLSPLELRAKEGLALINGTQATTALGILSLLRAERAVEVAEVAGATSLEGLMGTPQAFRAKVQEARPHPGQVTSASRLRALMEDSEIRESHRHGDPRVQDAYSLRCMPQVHGAAREALGYVRRILVTEANSATDNPLVFPDDGSVVSAGNFHGQVVAQALDFLCMALADLASISERRLERLLNPDLSGLPAFLSPEPGLRSGLMIAQVTVVDLLSEMRTLAHPASVDSVPTSAGQEDHVSMGLWAGRKVFRAVECLERVLGIELLAGVQALEFRRPLEPARRLRRVRSAVRERVPAVEEDRVLAPDLEAMARLVRHGGLHTVAAPDRGD